MKKVTKTPEQELAYHQEQMAGCEQTFVFHAIAAGDVLRAQKAKLDHGDWLDWLKEHWTRTARTATGYIELAEAENRKALLECETITDAKKLVKSEVVSDLNQEQSGKTQVSGCFEVTEPEQVAEDPNQSDAVESPKEPNPKPASDPESQAIAAVKIPGPKVDIEHICPLCRGEGVYHEDVELPQDFLDSGEFMTAWAKWIVFRREIGKSLKKSTKNSQIKTLSGFGIDGAIQSIERSIQNGWQGLFGPEKQGGDVVKNWKPPTLRLP